MVIPHLMEMSRLPDKGNYCNFGRAKPILILRWEPHDNSKNKVGLPCWQGWGIDKDEIIFQGWEV